jgi:membrane fusion protein (multidrug efflux system)
VDQSVSSPVSRTVTTPASPSSLVPPPVPPTSAPHISLSPRRSIWSAGRGRLPLGPRTLAIVAVVLAVLVYGGREIYSRFTHIYEYDARVTADIVTISSRADGWVMDIPVREGMRVAAGDVVARIDDRAAKLKIDAFRAQIEGVRAERTRLRAERRLTLNQADTLFRTRTSQTSTWPSWISSVPAPCSPVA